MAKAVQKERNSSIRSSKQKDLIFPPYNIRAGNAHTSICLLESTEPDILCQTLRAITKFAAQDVLNRNLLLNLNAIQHILPHVGHPELNIRRFALKALAQLCQLPRGPKQVLDDPQNLRKIARTLVKVEDVFVLEFASLVLAELTKEPLGCEQLMSANILNSLCHRMKYSLDPDVQKNCLQTLSNLVANPVYASEVTKNPQFSLSSLLVLTRSKFVAIQLEALKTLKNLICRYDDKALQKKFRESTGLLDLFDILETYEFRDVHSLVLEVLKNEVEVEENTIHLYHSGCILRLQDYFDTALPTKKPQCLAVLTKMSFSDNGRKALHETDGDIVFCNQLMSSNVEVLADAAMGVANMTQLLPSAMRMSDTNVIEVLCDIVNDDSMPWFYVRINALRAVVDFCRLIPKAAFSVTEPETFALLRNINFVKDYPIEAQRLAVQCYINLQNYHVSMRAMLNAEFMQELLDILQRIDIQLKIETCTAIEGLMREEVARDLFTMHGGEEVITNNLKIEHIGLRTALCTLIAASVTEGGADVYLDLGTIHYMVENKQARYAVSAWKPAIEAIFRKNSSAKFAYTGRLDINDFTQEGFYVQKRMMCPFPTLQTLASSPPPHCEPVYVCMFQRTYSDAASGLDIRTPHPQMESRVAVQSSSRLCMCVPILNDDYNLRTHLQRIKMSFGDAAKSMDYIEIDDANYEVRYRDKCQEVSSSLKQRAQLLGEYVADQMSGLTQERDCSAPSVELHVADIMADLDSRVIGIGWVKYGGALERAMLYKILADRVGLPCALCRASYGHTWCEVALPELDLEEPSDEEQRFPAGLLRANYVVDLMEQPGRLCRAGGVEARRVCGPDCAPYTARAAGPCDYAVCASDLSTVIGRLDTSE